MFQHPSVKSRSYGCGCGCNSCGGKTPAYGAYDSYGFTVSAGLPWGAKWNYAKEAKDLTIACRDFDKAVEEYLKAKERFDNTRSVFGIRVGGEGTRVDSAVDSMKKWKGKGQLALTKCRNREIDTPIGGGDKKASQREMQQMLEQFTQTDQKQVSDQGADRFSEGTSPFVYIIGASVVGLIGVGALLVWKKSQSEDEEETT